MTQSVTQCNKVRTITRTRIYRAVVSPGLLERIESCRYAQRALYNLGIACVAPEGGRLPPAQKSPHHPDAFFAQLTEWRTRERWIADIPVTVARPALVAARNALLAHESAVAERCTRIVDEQRAWTRWMQHHPDWDPGAWDALTSEQKREAVKAGNAPPKSLSTWRDERAKDGSRTAMFRTRKTSARCAVTFHEPPRRVDATTLRAPLLGNVEVVTNQGLPDASRLRALRVCTRTGRSGRTRVEVHLSVRIDVEAKRRRAHGRVRILGGDLGCAETVRWHDGSALKLPDHARELDTTLDSQRTMSRCTEGSRRWRSALARVRACWRRMRGRDRDAVRKACKHQARRCDVAVLEDVQSKPMSASALARGRPGAQAKRALNHKVRRALWGMTQQALRAAIEHTGGTFVQVLATDSSRTCAACGHVDTRSRDAKRFACTWCGHTDHADTNAARVVRWRGARWLILHEVFDSGARAHEALRREVFEARRVSKKRAPTVPRRARRQGTAARTKPRGATAEKHNGAKGAASSASNLRHHSGSGPSGCATEPSADRHKQRSHTSV